MARTGLAAISRKMRPMRRQAIFGLGLAVWVLGCTPASPTTEPSAGVVVGLPSATAAPASLEASPSPAPTAAIGFAFDAESIVGYYQGLFYACTDPGPSSKAEGYLYRSCRFLDPDGRTRLVGLVTDPADDLADAFASIQGKEGEAVLDPSIALEPLAAFLGATLGPTQGEGLLPWLAAHVGDAYSKTSLADLTIATYTASADDHSKLSVEIANRAYLDAPAPRASQ